MSTGPGLRERRREETLAAIRAAAHRELVEHGAAALSLRAVARDVGMAVSALYRYYAGRDELLTDLVVAGFTAQADAVQEALTSAREPVAAVGAALWAYRSWSLEHPAEFGLLYGAPVPGYAAPASTIPAGARVGDMLAEAVADLHRHGLVDAEGAVARARRLDRATRAEFARNGRRRGYDLPDAVVALLFDGFVRLHGVVVMEVFGQLRPLTDRPEDYVACLVDGIVTDLVGEGGARGSDGGDDQQLDDPVEERVDRRLPVAPAAASALEDRQPDGVGREGPAADEGVLDAPAQLVDLLDVVGELHAAAAREALAVGAGELGAQRLLLRAQLRLPAAGAGPLLAALLLAAGERVLDPVERGVHGLDVVAAADEVEAHRPHVPRRHRRPRPESS